MNINVQPATPEDFTALATLRWEFQREEEDVPPVMTKEAFVASCTSFFYQEAADGSWRHWLIKMDENIIGHASLKIIRSIPRPNSLVNEFGYLTNVYVQQPYRNQGMGKLLLRAVKKWNKEANLELLLVWPSERSFSFYERLGFKDAGEPLSLHF